MFPSEHRPQCFVQLDGALRNLQTFASMTAFHLEQGISLEQHRRADALLVLGTANNSGSKEAEEDRSCTLHIFHPLLEERQEERRYGQPGMVAAVGVVLDLMDDAPVQHLGLVELAAFNEIAAKEMTLRLLDLHSELLGAAAGEGRGQLTAGSTLVLPGDGGVIL